MDKEQHITQDAAEHYAVFAMAKHAELLGIARQNHSSAIYEVFKQYLADRNWTVQDFTSAHYPQYKINVDAQVPRFVERLQKHLPGKKFEFAINEAEFRRLGMKADFTIAMSETNHEHYVSLKNYIGSGGIERPQVSSGTFLSFAAGFVFDRVGVGSYTDPRSSNALFQGSNRSERDAVLDYEGRSVLKLPLQVLDTLQQEMRDQMLAPDMEMYDERKIKSVIANIVPRGQAAMLEIFSLLGMDHVRNKFLERAGLAGTEDILYFDENNFLDSITNRRFNVLRAEVNDRNSEFSITPVGQSLRFAFTSEARHILAVDVPLTINTNGAWHRPKQRYTGTQTKNDKGHLVELQWGQRRPYKSKEIATSTNTYINLKKAGIFDI